MTLFEKAGFALRGRNGGPALQLYRHAYFLPVHTVSSCLAIQILAPVTMLCLIPCLLCRGGLHPFGSVNPNIPFLPQLAFVRMFITANTK